MVRKVTIIGAGPGGYPAAIRLAASGVAVTLIERERIGGTCLNRGCIPTKALLQCAIQYRAVKDAAGFGLNGTVSFLWEEVHRYKQTTVNQLVAGLEGLFRHHRIEVKHGTGRVIAPGRVIVVETGETIEADAIILATGSESVLPEVPGIERAVSSDEILKGETNPSRLAVIGGGVIGVEIAQIYVLLGTEVTVFELLPEVLPGFDRGCVQIYRHYLEGLGIDVITGVQVEAVEEAPGDSILIRYRDGDRVKSYSCDVVLSSVGRRPNYESVWDPSVPISVRNGAIVVDSHQETSVKGIFAVGDCVGGIMLAHKAMKEGEDVAERLLGIPGKGTPPSLIPRCVYGKVELVSVGLAYEEAIKAWGEDQVRKGRFPMRANGMAAVLKETEGLVQVVVAGPYEEIVGVQIMSPHAVEMIPVGVLAIQQECTFDELKQMICPHPSMSESIREAVLSVKGEAIHIL